MEDFRIRLVIEPVDHKSLRKRYYSEMCYSVDETRNPYFPMMMVETAADRVRALLNLYINQE